MKKKIKLVSLFLAAGIVFSGCANKAEQKKNEDEKEKVTASTGEATERTKGWFLNSTEEYIKEQLKTDDCKLYASVYDVRDGIDSENALLYASADMYLYLDAENMKDQDVSEFSDTFARKLASDGASGSISFTVYTVPKNIYSQIEEGNHRQVEEKASDLEGYKKYGFEYSGIGDAVYSNESSSTDVEDTVDGEVQDLTP